jgi:hypothetical protein
MNTIKLLTIINKDLRSFIIKMLACSIAVIFINFIIIFLSFNFRSHLEHFNILSNSLHLIRVIKDNTFTVMTIPFLIFLAGGIIAPFHRQRKCNTVIVVKYFITTFFFFVFAYTSCYLTFFYYSFKTEYQFAPQIKTSNSHYAPEFPK